MPMKPTNRFRVHLPGVLIETFRKYCKDNDMSMSECARTAIIEYMNNH
jgi:hypothetical protein